LLFRNLSKKKETRKPDVVLFPKLDSSLKYGVNMGHSLFPEMDGRAGIYVFYIQDGAGDMHMYGKVGSSVSLYGRFNDYRSSKSYHPNGKPKSDGRIRDRIKRILSRGYVILIEVYYAHRNPKIVTERLRINNSTYNITYRQGNCTSLERAYRYNLVCEDIDERWERQPRGPADSYINRV